MDVQIFAKATRKSIERFLSDEGCAVVLDPVTNDPVTFDLVELRDDMVLTALARGTTMHTQVQRLRGCGRKCCARQVACIAPLHLSD